VGSAFPAPEVTAPGGDPAQDLSFDPTIQGWLTPTPYLRLRLASYVHDAPLGTAGQILPLRERGGVGTDNARRHVAST
jgi:hypothetical protein